MGDTPNSMDDHIAKDIAEVMRGVRHYSFEEASFQLEMLDDVFKIWEEVRKPFPSPKLDLSTGKSYQCGDVTAGCLECMPQFLVFPEVHRVCLSKRNLKWWRNPAIFQAPRNPSWRRPTMVIVGAHHLYGSTGLLNLSTSAGWKVERGPVEWPVGDFDASKSDGFKNDM